MALSVLQVAAGMPHWGGAELHLLTLSDQLRQRGHAVTVACWPGRWVEQRAQQMGFATVPMTLESVRDRRDLGRMCRFLRDNKIDVLHAHSDNDFFVPPLAAIGARVPVRLMTRHLPHPVPHRRASVSGNLLFSKVVAVSESVRRTLIGSGMRPAQVETIHHGTDVQAFAQMTLTVAESRAQLGIPDGCVGVGILGRIAPEKGHRVLLEALAMRGDRQPSLWLVVAGEGPDEENLRAMAGQMGLAGQVIFTGFRDDVNNVVGALDIVVSASTWDEPCTAVVQQGMALHKPVIGTRVGGTPEMIVEGETGFLVPPGDAGAMAQALAMLAEDRGMRERMGEAGRSRVEEHFSLGGMMEKIEELYGREYRKARGPAALRAKITF